MHSTASCETDTHRPDHRDLALSMQADTEHDLLERIASLEADVIVYRDLAQQGLHALHDVTNERDRLREQQRRERDEHRRLRESIMATEAGSSSTLPGRAAA